MLERLSKGREEEEKEERMRCRGISDERWIMREEVKENEEMEVKERHGRGEKIDEEDIEEEKKKREERRTE